MNSSPRGRTFMNEERKGELFIFGESFLWGLFPIVTILSLNSLPPTISLAWSTLFAAVFFAGILTVKKRWGELKNKEALKYILWVTFFISVLYYVLSFSSLRYTSAGNVSIINLTQIFFSFLLFHVWRKDFIAKEHIFGACLMIIGAVIVLYPNLTKFNVGDLLILSAAFIAPIGNFFQQKARQLVTSETILFVRSLLAIPFILIFSHFFHQTSTFLGFKQSIIFLLINGSILLGLSKIFWVEAIHRISVTKAAALSSFSPAVTLFFAWLVLSDSPTIWQLLALAPMILGVILLSTNKIPTVKKAAI